MTKNNEIRIIKSKKIHKLMFHHKHAVGFKKEYLKFTNIFCEEEEE